MADKMVAESTIYFFLISAEVNAVNSCAHSRGVKGEDGLNFRKKLAVQMMEYNIDDDLIHRSPIRVRNTRARMSMS